jgi:aryl-alcohol dehydrogenase-like predicted oxidoreductase
MRFGRRTAEADAIWMLDRAPDAGIHCLDTVNIGQRAHVFILGS